MSGLAPGPWRVAKNEENIRTAPWTGAIGIEAFAPPDEIPPIVAWTARGWGGDDNAILIAAAPSLLLALEELVAQIDFVRVRPQTREFDRSALRTARSAIAYAKGRNK